MESSASLPAGDVVKLLYDGRAGCGSWWKAGSETAVLRDGVEVGVGWGYR